jgi:hypothetical protein
MGTESTVARATGVLTSQSLGGSKVAERELYESGEMCRVEEVNNDVRPLMIPSVTCDKRVTYLTIIDLPEHHTKFHRLITFNMCKNQILMLFTRG